LAIPSNPHTVKEWGRSGSWSKLLWQQPNSWPKVSRQTSANKQNEKVPLHGIVLGRSLRPAFDTSGEDWWLARHHLQNRHIDVVVPLHLPTERVHLCDDDPKTTKAIAIVIVMTGWQVGVRPMKQRRPNLLELLINAAKSVAVSGENTKPNK